MVGSEFNFHDQGTYKLKGVPGEWNLYTVELWGALSLTICIRLVFPANHVKKPVALNYCGELKARGGYAAYDVDREKMLPLQHGATESNRGLLYRIGRVSADTDADL